MPQEAQPDYDYVVRIMKVIVCGWHHYKESFYFLLCEFFLFYCQPCFNAFFEPIRLTTNKAMTTPTVTKDTSSRLKLSGNRSNPLDGEVRVKKRSGPPNAKIRDCDSKEVVEDTTERTDSTVLL